MRDILYISYDGMLDALAYSQIYPYLSKLAEKGFKINVLSFEKSAKTNNHAELSKQRQRLGVCGVIWMPLRYHKSPSIPATVYDILQGVFFGLKAVIKDRIGIIHARGHISALIGVFLKYTTGARLIFDMRGFWPDEKVDAGCWKKDGLLHAIFKTMERYLINVCDEVIVLTNAASNYLRKSSKEKLPTVIPCCVDSRLFRPYHETAILPKELHGRFVVAYSGSLGTFYNLEEMANFFIILKEQRKDAFFLLITSCALDACQESLLMRKLDKPDYMVTHAAYASMPFLLSASSVSIMFYRRTLSYRGCSPVKFAESLSCGVPVVINSGIGDSENIVNQERVGIVVSDFSDSGYRNSISKLNELLSDSASLERRCRFVAENYFSLDEGAEKYSQLYQKYHEC